VEHSAEQLRDHLERPRGRGVTPADAFTGAAGGAACGDLVRISLALRGDDPHGRIAAAGFDASGCGAAQAAGSATVALIEGAPLLEAARIGPPQIAAELGGLSPGKQHAAELAADALHRALGHAARSAQLAQPGLADGAAGSAHETGRGRTLVAMSGGVDSAVAALLCARTSEAVAVTLELWSDPDNDGELSCCSAQAVRSARTLAHSLGMPHLSIDLREEFRAGVVDPWIDAHAAGLTPNPCIRCNGNVRLDAMLELADRLGAGTLATGHYARVLSEQRVGRGEQLLLMGAADVRKDQSYVLCALSQQSLRRMRFPLGELRKERVREIAREAGLAVASKRDSQDLCFLAGTRTSAFLQRHGALQPQRGEIRDAHGRVLGAHGGVHAYTVGQRRGLRISAPQPQYVLATDAAANTLTVGPRSQLLASAFTAREVELRAPAARVDSVRVRAHGRKHACTLGGALGEGTHAHALIELAQPAERTAPGQLACLYAGDVVVGHGTIAA
jgi:tRNA-specific 2-thiouridylase